MASVDLRLVLKGQRDVAQGLSEVEGDLRDVGNAAEEAGKKADRSSGRLGKVGGVLGGLAKRGVMAGVAGGIGLVGTALYKGFNRLNGLDQARAKLTGLGHDASSVQAIMDNALTSVRGTAFGMDEAAGTAATMAAAGIKPGKQMENILRLVGDTATIAGTGMGEMGAIWGKVAARGKLDGEVMAQLLERQIGILPALAEHYGVSAEEASKMVSQGKVDFNTFATVMDKTLGGAAQESGKTFQGALKNAGAALGRFGAALLGPVFERGPAVFTAITKKIDDLQPVAERVGSGLASAFSAVVTVATTLYGIGQKVVSVLSNPVFQAVAVVIGVTLVGAYAGAIASAIAWNAALLLVNAVTLASSIATKAAAIGTKLWTAAQWLLNAAMAANPIGLVVGLVLGLVAAFVLAYNRSEAFRNAVDSAWNAVKRLGSWLTDKIVGALATVGAGFLQLGIWGVQAFRLVLSAAFKAFDGILKAADKGLSWIPGLGGKIAGARKTFADFSDKTVGKLQKVENQLRAAKNEADRLAKDRSATITITRREITEKITKIVRKITDGTRDLFGGTSAGTGPPRTAGPSRPEMVVPEVSGYIPPRVPDPPDLSAAEVAVGRMGPGRPLVIQAVLPDGQVLAETTLDAFDDAEARL